MKLFYFIILKIFNFFHINNQTQYPTNALINSSLAFGTSLSSLTACAIAIAVSISINLAR